MRWSSAGRIAAFVVVVSALLAGGVAGGAPQPSNTTSAAVHRGTMVAPKLISFRLPQSDGVRYTPNARNIAIGSPSPGPLLLFLPATRAVPADYRNFLETASSVGYHVLALDYWNLGRSVARTCGADARCYGQVQANRFDGSRPSRFSAIAPSDSILSRLTHAITVLTIRDPRGEWGRYLDAEGVRWNRIVVAGHSQGGGESAFIAHFHRVQGVLMFASPVASDGAVAAGWLSRPGATPMSRFYGFDSVDDMYFARIQGSWAALRLGAAEPPVRVRTAVPVGGSHRIITDLPLGTAAESHSRMVADSGPRTATGIPVFRPIWRWMLQAVLPN